MTEMFTSNNVKDDSGLVKGGKRKSRIRSGEMKIGSYEFDSGGHGRKWGVSGAI